MKPDEQIAQVQLMYYPCYGYSKSTGIVKLSAGLLYLILGTLEYALVLTNLRHITDDDIAEVMKLEGYDIRAYHSIVPEGIQIQTAERVGKTNGLDCITWSGLKYQTYLYLVRQHYAVPLWFGIEHADNGKTAIEMDIGEDIEHN